MYKFILLAIFNFVLTIQNGIAQDIVLHKTLISNKNKTTESAHYSGIHGFYKKYISSQDGANCQFTPSCSHYAKLAIQKYPFPIGLFLSADRLLRCNGRSDDHFTTESGKAIDRP
jgi:putative component of membrane protein insertase Oxa1/YidC/SpoIIIJ protein YidD